MKYVVIYLVVVNIMTCLLYGLDKLKAIKDYRRIPEKVLLGMAIIGGSVGAAVGMQVFRHKIRKRKFKLGVPLIFVLQLAVIIYFGFVQ